MTEPERGATVPGAGKRPTRIDVVLSLIVFQFKLFVDGLRDVLFSPLSLVAGIAGILAGGDEPDRYLRQLMRAGQQTDQWINLFGNYDPDGTADELLEPLQSAARDSLKQQAQRARAHLLAGQDPEREPPQD